MKTPPSDAIHTRSTLNLLYESDRKKRKKMKYVLRVAFIDFSFTTLASVVQGSLPIFQLPKYLEHARTMNGLTSNESGIDEMFASQMH